MADASDHKPMQLLLRQPCSDSNDLMVDAQIRILNQWANKLALSRNGIPQAEAKVLFEDCGTEYSDEQELSALAIPWAPDISQKCSSCYGCCSNLDIAKGEGPH